MIRRKMRVVLSEEAVTLFLINLAGIMERADEALLPGVYKEVGMALHADPTGLGSLTLFRSIVQAACFPIAAYLAIHHNRAHVIALGAFLWAFATFLVGISTNFSQVAISRGLNGIGLALVTPSIQSLVADSTDESNRGMAFGWLQMTGNFGSILGGLFSVLIASTTVMGIPGWRVSFYMVALVSVIVGLLVRLFANDPRFSKEQNACSSPTHRAPFATEIKELFEEAKAVMKVPSFQIIVAQGVTGSFPWSALAFAAMWLELMGYTHQQTAFLMTMFAISGSMGGLFGGYMGDYLAKRLPNSGRIILAQISSASAIPIAAILMLALPENSTSFFSHGLILFIMGLFISWNAPAANNPIFAEIVPEKARTSIYALDRSFESILSSFAPPFVGILAQYVYGYKPVLEGSTGEAGVETDRANAASLSKALYVSIAIPMTLCCLIYSFLYCTYPRDKQRAKMQSLNEAEAEQIELEDGELPEIDTHRTHDKSGCQPLKQGQFMAG